MFRDFLDCSFMYELLNKIFDRDTYHEKFGLSSMAAHIIPPGGEALPLHIDSQFRIQYQNGKLDL